MNNFDVKDVIGVIGTILGVIIGGLITLLVTHLQYRNQEKQRNSGKKINAYEEIHKHLSTLAHEAEYAFIQIVDKISRGMSVDEKERTKLPWQELEMLINFYAPALKENFKIIREAWESLGRTLGLVIIEKYSKGEGPAELLAKSKVLSDQIEKQVNLAKDKLAKLTTEIVQ